jgi:hypothetical protein
MRGSIIVRWPDVADTQRQAYLDGFHDLNWFKWRDTIYATDWLRGFKQSRGN